MRIVRLKLDQDVLDYCKILCKRYRINDIDFVADLYAFCELKGGGLPDDARLNALCNAYSKLLKKPLVVIKSVLNKRRQLIKDFGRNPLFLLLVSKKRSAGTMCEALLDFFKKLYERRRQCQCVTCALLTQCDFGKQYNTAVTSITVVVDPDFDKKVHADCPERPTLDFNQRLVEARQVFEKMASTVSAKITDEKFLAQVAEDVKTAESSQEAAPKESAIPPMPRQDVSIEDWEEGELDEFRMLTGDGDSRETQEYNTAFLGKNANPIKVDPTLINTIAMSKLLLFELAQKLSSKLGKAHKGKFKPTVTPTKRQKTSNIQSSSEVTRVLPKEHAKDDDTFLAGMANHSLVKRQSLQTETKKKLLYILLDTSESMLTTVAENSRLWSVIRRETLARIFSIALCQFIRDEGGILFLRCFDGGQGPLMSAREPLEFDHMIDYISSCSFKGLSTSINGVLNRAASDIENAKNELSSAEVLMITDMGARMDPSDAKRIGEKYEKIVLNVLDVFTVEGNKSLIKSLSCDIEEVTGKLVESFADSYFRVNPEATLDNLVSLVGGRKKNVKV